MGMEMEMGMEMGITMGMEMGTGNGNWEWRLGLGTGSGDWELSSCTNVTRELAKKIDSGQRNQGCGVVLHVQEEVYQYTLTFRRRVVGYQE